MTAPRPIRRLRAGVATARWTAAQHRQLQRTLPRGGTGGPLAPPPARMSARNVRIVLAALRVRRASCLERSLVLQAWLAGHGDRRDVVIGVRHEDSLLAHAWVDGLEDGSRYVELHRLSA